MKMSYQDQKSKQTDGLIKTYLQCMNMTPTIKTQDLYAYVIKKYENQVNPDEPIFYYHSDHLGSASYITNKSGIETQHIVYLPFGEDWVDMKYNTQQFDTPYKFNGKEKDTETGYNYYGARYYSDNLSIFLSVDPMSDKYPDESNYIYCSNNPILFIDPDGNEKLIWVHREKESGLAKAQEKYKDDGAIHIFSHGNSGGLGAYINGKEYKNIKDAKTLNALLNKYSKVWQNRKEGESLTIVLHACNTGKETTDKDGNKMASFAEKLSQSEEMKDVNIIAPTERDWFNDKGEVGTYKSIPKKDEKGNDKKDGGKRSNVKGQWATFRNGEKVDSHKGNWKPKEVAE